MYSALNTKIGRIFDKNENKVDDEEKKKLRSMVEPVA